MLIVELVPDLSSPSQLILRVGARVGNTKRGCPNDRASDFDANQPSVQLQATIFRKFSEQSLPQVRARQTRDPEGAAIRRAPHAMCFLEDHLLQIEVLSWSKATLSIAINQLMRCTSDGIFSADAMSTSQLSPPGPPQAPPPPKRVTDESFHYNLQARTKYPEGQNIPSTRALNAGWRWAFSRTEQSNILARAELCVLWAVAHWPSLVQGQPPNTAFGARFFFVLTLTRPW